MADNVEVIGDPQVLQGKHLKFRARQNGKSFDALCWTRPIGGISCTGAIASVWRSRS